MHWFWRAIAAITIGAVLGPQIFHFIVDPISAGGEVFGNSWCWWGDRIFALIPVVALPVMVYALLSHMFGPKAVDPETRCRKCGYILRGISEPRCPECGERI
jgi:hypothetical protein